MHVVVRSTADDSRAPPRLRHRPRRHDPDRDQDEADLARQRALPVGNGRARSRRRGSRCWSPPRSRSAASRFRQVSVDHVTYAGYSIGSSCRSAARGRQRRGRSASRQSRSACCASMWMAASGSKPGAAIAYRGDMCASSGCRRIDGAVAHRRGVARDRRRSCARSARAGSTAGTTARTCTSPAEGRDGRRRLAGPAGLRGVAGLRDDAGRRTASALRRAAWSW